MHPYPRYLVNSISPNIVANRKRVRENTCPVPLRCEYLFIFRDSKDWFELLKVFSGFTTP